MSLRPLLVVATLVLIAPVDALAQGKRAQPVTVTIGEGKVSPDHFGNTYTDYRAAQNPGKCVEITADLPFLRFNRHYPDSSTRDFEYCENADSGAYYDQKRQFWIEIPNVAACAVFSPADGPDPLVGPDLHVRQPFAYWLAGRTACRVNGSDKPRLRIENAFKARPGTRTPVVFLILSYDSQTAFEVQATALVMGTSAVRTFVNEPGRLVTLIRNSNAVNVPNETIATFSLPFELTLTKVTPAP